MYRSRKKGATLAFVAACAFVLCLIGTAIFYIFQLFSGDKQIMNATDAGALAAAQQLLTVTLTPAQVQALPSEFTGLGVDSNGNRCPNGQDSNGNPALYNIIAYNNCAAYSLEIAFNAASSGSSTAIANACTVIEGLNTFAQQLSKNIQTSTYPATAASQIMENNSTNNLPSALFGGVTEPATLVPGSLKAGYYASSNAYSDLYFPTAFTSSSTQIAAWVNQVLSSTSSANKGPKLIAAAKPFDLNKITGQTGFVDSTGNDLVISLVPMATQLTHLISLDGGYYSTTPPGSGGKSNYYLPPNAVQLQGEVIGSAISSGRSGKKGSLGLVVSSGAVASNGGQYVASIPSSGSSGGSGSGSTSSGSSGSTGSSGSAGSSGGSSGGTSSGSGGSPGSSSGSGSSTSGGTSSGTQTQGAAYIAIVNDGDYNTAMNNAGYSAAQVQQNGYSNIDLTGNTNIAFDHSKTNIFDLLQASNPTQNYPVTTMGYFGYPTTTIIVGVNSNIGIYAANTSSSSQLQTTLQNAYNFEVSGTYPSINYNNVVDNQNSPSIPFVLSLNNNQPYANGGQSVSPAAQYPAFYAWIVYNRSNGSDALGHDPSLDPLKNSGGSPALFNSNPNAPVPNTIVHATSTVGGLMSIADALQITDIAFIQGGPQMFGRKQPAWVYNLLPIVASNYGYPYLPVPLNETKPNGFTAIEWIKAQLTCLNGGAGLSQNIPVLPSQIVPPIYGGNFTQAGGSPNYNSPYSGLRYFVPFDNSGNRVHYSWPEPAGCPKFETPGTPLQLIQNINRGETGNAGQFVSTEANYTSVLNAMLNVTQQMNPSVTMDDLLGVLNSGTIDLGQTLFIICNSSQQQYHGLQLVSTLPGNMTYVPLTGVQPAVGNNVGTAAGLEYGLCAMVSLYSTDIYTSGILADTNPNSSVTITDPYSQQSYTPAPYADSFAQGGPTYPGLSGYGGSIMYPYLTGLATVFDYAYFARGSGTNNNHGELHFREYLGTPWFADQLSSGNAYW